MNSSGNIAQSCPAPPTLKGQPACSWLDKDPPVREYSRRHGFNWPPHIHQVIAWLAVFAVFLCSVGLAHSLRSAPFSLCIGLATTCFLVILALKLSVTLRDSAIPQIQQQRHIFYSARRPLFIPGKTASHVIVQKQEHPYIGYCHVCQLDVTPGTKHCRQCNKCIAGWDHHCTWLNTCIGISNFSHFLLFVSATFLSTLLFVLFHLVMLLLYFSCAPSCFQPAPPDETTTPGSHQATAIPPLNQSSSTVGISHAVSASQSSHDKAPMVLYFYRAQVPTGVWFFCLSWSIMLCVVTLAATGNLVFIYFQLIRKRQSATIFYQLEQQKEMDQSEHSTLRHLSTNVTKHFPFLEHLQEKLRPASTTSPSSKTSVTLTTSESASQSVSAASALSITKHVDSIQNTQRLSAETLSHMELTNGNSKRLQAGSRFDNGHYDNLGFQMPQEALPTLNSGDGIRGVSGAPNMKPSSIKSINTSNLNIYHHPNFHRRYNLPFFHSPNIQHWYYPSHPQSSEGHSHRPVLFPSHMQDSAKSTDDIPTKIPLPRPASSIAPSSGPTNNPDYSPDPPIMTQDIPFNSTPITRNIPSGVSHLYKSIKDSSFGLSKMNPWKTTK